MGKDKLNFRYVMWKEVCISTVKLLTGIILQLFWNLEIDLDGK